MHPKRFGEFTLLGKRPKAATFTHMIRYGPAHKIVKILIRQVREEFPGKHTELPVSGELLKSVFNIFRGGSEKALRLTPDHFSHRLGGRHLGHFSEVSSASVV